MLVNYEQYSDVFSDVEIEVGATYDIPYRTLTGKYDISTWDCAEVLPDGSYVMIANSLAENGAWPGRQPAYWDVTDISNQNFVEKLDEDSELRAFYNSWSAYEADSGHGLYLMEYSKLNPTGSYPDNLKGSGTYWNILSRLTKREGETNAKPVWTSLARGYTSSYYTESHYGIYCIMYDSYNRKYYISTYQLGNTPGSTSAQPGYESKCIVAPCININPRKVKVVESPWGVCILKR